MAQTAANLTAIRAARRAAAAAGADPLPHALRPLVAYNRTLLGCIYAIFYSGIQRFYQRRLAELGHRDGRTGSVTAIQRASSDLRLNPHLHGVFLDGVFVEQDGGELSLIELPELSDLDVCELLQSIWARVLEQLRHQALRQRAVHRAHRDHRLLHDAHDDGQCLRGRAGARLRSAEDVVSCE